MELFPTRGPHKIRPWYTPALREPQQERLGKPHGVKPQASVFVFWPTQKQSMLWQDRVYTAKPQAPQVSLHCFWITQSPQIPVTLHCFVSVVSPLQGQPLDADKQMRVLRESPHWLHVPWHEVHSLQPLQRPSAKQQLVGRTGLMTSLLGKGPQMIEPLEARALKAPQQERRGNLQGEVPQYSNFALIPVHGHPWAAVRHVRVIVTWPQEPQVSVHWVVGVHSDQTPSIGQQTLTWQ